MLTVAEKRLEGDAVAASGDILRRIGILYATLEEETRAAELFAAAIAADQRSLEVAEGADTRAQLLFSLARTLAAQGLPVEAANTAARARRTAVSARTRFDIERWLAELDEHRSAQ